jgi:hypothetical protein
MNGYLTETQNRTLKLVVEYVFSYIVMIHDTVK